MDSCYSDDHIAGAHIKTDKIICNIEKPQQKYRLRRVGNRFMEVGGEGGGGGGGGIKHVLLVPKSHVCVCSGSKRLVCMKVS